MSLRVKKWGPPQSFILKHKFSSGLISQISYLRNGAYGVVVFDSIMAITDYATSFL